MPTVEPGLSSESHAEFVEWRLFFTRRQTALLASRGFTPVSATAVGRIEDPASVFVCRCVGTYLDLQQLVADGNQILVRRSGERPRILDLALPGADPEDEDEALPKTQPGRDGSIGR